MDDNPEQHIARVAVAPFLSRSEAHRHLREGLNQLRFRIVLAKIDHAFVHCFRTTVVGDTRGVGQQLADGDVVPGGRRFGNVLRDFVVQPHLPFFEKHHDSHGGELFANRAGLENRFGRHRNVALDVGQAVASGLHDLAVAAHREANSRDFLRLLLRFDGQIHSGGKRGVTIPLCLCKSRTRS